MTTLCLDEFTGSEILEQAIPHDSLLARDYRTLVLVAETRLAAEGTLCEQPDCVGLRAGEKTVPSVATFETEYRPTGLIRHDGETTGVPRRSMDEAARFRRTVTVCLGCVLAKEGERLRQEAR